MTATRGAAPAGRAGAAPAAPDVTKAQRAVLDVLELGPASPEAVVAAAGVPVRRAWLALAVLVALGRVRKRGDFVELVAGHAPQESRTRQRRR